MRDRKEKISSLIHEIVARYIQHEANTDPLITVTHIMLSSDKSHASIYITTIPDSKEEQALIFLKRNGGKIKHALKKETRLKIIPHIDFVIDSGERNRQSIDDITRAVL